MTGARTVGTRRRADLILAALDSPGMGVPPRTMATTIANVRRPYFMSDESRDGRK